MKNQCLLFIISLGILYSNQTNSQICSIGSVSFNYQMDVDSFLIKYPGCNTANEILSKCQIVGIDEAEQDRGDILKIDHETQEEITITYTLKQTASRSLEILNTSGASIKKYKSNRQWSGLNEEKISISDLPSGFYFIKLQIKNRFGIQKFTKL